MRRSFQLNLGSVHRKFCLLVSMAVVYRAVFHSLIVEDKSSFTVGLLHAVCAMASPVEGVALAIINNIVSSELDGVGRWRHVR